MVQQVQPLDLSFLPIRGSCLLSVVQRHLWQILTSHPFTLAEVAIPQYFSRIFILLMHCSTATGLPEFAHVFAEVELDDMIDDASIDSFLLDFKRKSRMPFAASKIQSWWRMARQCRAFWRYRMGKAKRRSKFKQRVFNGWHGLSAAQGRCRNLYLNISFRYWIKYVMDSKGWVNFCSEACNILSQRPSGLPARVLWNICIDPSTWKSAQEEDRAMGDPLPIRGLVVALQVTLILCTAHYSLIFCRAVFARLLLKMYFAYLSALDKSIQMGCRTACERKAETGALVARSIQREISPQISNVVSMGFFHSCKASSHSASRFYGIHTFLGIVG